MKIRMKVDISGARNGQAWPARGEIIELPDGEAADLCASGMAEPVADADVEKAVVPDDSEQRALTSENSAAVTPAVTDQKKPAPAKKTAAKKAAAKPPAANSPAPASE